MYKIGNKHDLLPILYFGTDKQMTIPLVLGIFASPDAINILILTYDVQ